MNLSVTITDVTSTAIPAPSTTISAAAIQGAIDTALGTPGATVNIPGIVGAPTAIAGFTGATGGVQQTQLISNWNYGTSIPIQAAPNLTSVVIGDGTIQRSVFNSFTLNFDEVVNLAAGALTINKVTTGGLISTDPHPILTSVDVTAGVTVTNPSLDGKTWVVTVLAGGVLDNGFGDFLDSIYTFTVHAANITNGSGGTLNGGDQTHSFEKRYGDINDDGVVGNIDFGQFKTAFAKSAAVPSVNTPKFDVNHDGIVGNTDFGKFKANFGKQQWFLADGTIQN